MVETIAITYLRYPKKRIDNEYSNLADIEYRKEGTSNKLRRDRKKEGGQREEKESEEGKERMPIAREGASVRWSSGLVGLDILGQSHT